MLTVAVVCEDVTRRFGARSGQGAGLWTFCPEIVRRRFPQVARQAFFGGGGVPESGARGVRDGGECVSLSVPRGKSAGGSVECPNGRTPYAGVLNTGLIPLRH